MDCEICGRNDDELFLISIEGTKLRVCSDCSRCGSFISRVESAPDQRTHITTEAPEIDVVDNYAELIRGARESTGLDQEQFAKKLNESLSVMKKIEAGKMVPTEKLSKKMEKMFRIKLFQVVRRDSIETKKTETSLSLGDVAVIKK